jgi:hypothetical protein
MNLQKLREALKISSIPVVIASLCCLSPVILVSLGIASVSFASSLADILYGQYKWVFRGVGLIALCISLYHYATRSLGVCSIDDVVRRRNELINKSALALIVAVLGYVFFLYGVVHYVGVFLNLWR